MEWSGQPSQTPGTASQPAVGPVAVPNYPANNPLQSPGLAAAPIVNPPSQFIGAPAAPIPTANPDPMRATAPVTIQPPIFGQTPAMPVAAQPVPAAGQTDDNTIDADDVAWVQRAKEAVGSSKGDPHRQVQLLQHLRAQYLKQRFGRTVHTDEA